MSKRKSPAQLYAERYSHTGYTVATTHAPQFGPNVIVQDNTWELTREIKILPQPFENPGGAASIRSIKFLIPPVVAETWIPSECSLSLSYDVNKADGTALTRPAATANVENVHARYAGWPNAMLIDDLNVTINGSTTLQNLDRDWPLRKYMTFITNATDLTRKRPAATQIFDWDEEYDSDTDKVRVLDGGKFFIPVDFSTAKDGGKTTGPFMEHPVDVELTFGAREARLGGDINNMRLLAFYNTVENLWLSDPINKNYYQPREQTDYPGAAGRSITPSGEPLSKIMRT